LRERLDYQEKSLQGTINQLVGQDWTFGAQYRVTWARLHDDFPDVIYPLPFMASYTLNAHRELQGILQNANLYAIYNSPCGFFAIVNGAWYGQSNAGYTPDEPGGEFFQVDAYVGYRFWHRAAQIMVGVKNIGDQGYNLNPLTAYNPLPRERTVFTSLQVSF
jgi:hypothetical protein